MMPDWVRSHAYEAHKRLAEARRAMASLARHPAMTAEVLATEEWLALSDGVGQACRMCECIEAAYSDADDEEEVW